MGYDSREDFARTAGPGREALKAFLRRIFGLDLDRWDALGYWDRRYRPFSLFEGDEMVASVCLYSLDLVVKGRACRGAQISAVGTREDLRRQGLNRQLTARAQAWARETGHPFFFLFATEMAVPFYRKLGFRAVEEHVPWVEVEGRPRLDGARKLDMDREADRALLLDLARRRAPVSLQLGVLSWELLMFHALHTMPEDLFHIPELEVVVAARSHEAGLHVHDVVGPTVPELDEWYPYVAHERVRELSFGFLPDRMGLTEWKTRVRHSEKLHVMGEIPLPDEQLFFPHTARA